MAGIIIMCIVSFGCGILFYAIGLYAQKRTEPMWFWSGSQVKASEITDVQQYNQANGRMWKCYSLWYFAAGAASIGGSVFALVFLVLGCTLGSILLPCWYNRIYQKYSVQ